MELLEICWKAEDVGPLMDNIPSRQTRGGRMFWVRRNPFHDNMDDMWSFMENWMKKRSSEDEQSSGYDGSEQKLGHKFGYQIEQQYLFPL